MIDYGYDDDFYNLCSGDVLGIKILSEVANLNVDIPDELSKLLAGRLKVSYSDEFFDMFNNVYNSVIDYNKRVINIDKYIKDKYSSFYMKKSSFKIDTKESINLSKCFFDSFNKDILKFYDDILDNNDIIIKKFYGMGDGYTLGLSSQHKSLILVDESDSIDLAFTLVHEIIHAYVFSYLYEITNDQRINIELNNLDEVITFFSELVFMKYLKDINYDMDGIDYLKNQMIYRFIHFSSEFGYYNGIDNIKYNYNSYCINESNSYGVLLAMHYFEKYLSDEGIWDDLFDMTLDCSNKDRCSLLNEYGIDMNDVTLEKTEKIIRMI